jgi:hypothetical protein
MKVSNRNLIHVVLFLISVLATGCVSNKNYRDATGIVKTDTRSAAGVNK